MKMMMLSSPAAARGCRPAVVRGRLVRLSPPRALPRRAGCASAARLLSRSLDEPLGGPARALLLRHLHGCPACRRLLGVFRRERLLLAELARRGRG
jgi:hypothetical protein